MRRGCTPVLGLPFVCEQRILTGNFLQSASNLSASSFRSFSPEICSFRKIKRGRLRRPFLYSLYLLISSIRYVNS
ncbi:hypothetical protein M378DRAFT_170784, partial [Amanita muscaria Koide BX008]